MFPDGHSEPEFIDAVSRNLRRGRILLLVVGDGIQEGVDSIGKYLQSHAGAHFTLSFVEMAVYQLPQDGYIVQPHLIMQTVNIERGIVRIVDSNTRVEAMPLSVQLPVPSRSVRLSEERMREEIRLSVPGAIEALDEFLVEADGHGVFIEASTKSLMLKWQGPDENTYTLGGFKSSGEFITYPVNWAASSRGRVDLAHEYLHKIANLVGGTLRKTADPTGWYVVKSGVQLPMAMDILSRKADWLSAIDWYAAHLTDAIATIKA